MKTLEKVFLLLATIVVLALAVKTLVMKPLPPVQVPSVEADYKIVVSNTGYLIYDGSRLVGYVDYTDTDKLSNVIIKDNK